jgi:hypothetical protein
MDLRNRQTIIFLPLGILLLLLGCTLQAQAPAEKPARARRVFTNEDLQKYGAKYGSMSEPELTPNSASDVNSSSKGSAVATSTGEKGEQALWTGKLKEAETALQKAKADEAKFAAALEKSQEKLREAKSDFHIKTSQEQIADSLKNLARAKDQVKHSEEEKTTLLAEAAKKGFKPDKDGQAGPAASQAK